MSDKGYRRRSRYVDNPYGFESERRESWHESNHFLLKGRNGVILNKTPADVEEIFILDRYGEELYTGSKKVFYFMGNDEDKTLVIMLRDGSCIKYIFDSTIQAFRLPKTEEEIKKEEEEAKKDKEKQKEKARREKGYAVARMKGMPMYLAKEERRAIQERENLEKITSASRELQYSLGSKRYQL